MPASRQGYGPITLSGTAAAGATVELYESAYVFNDFYAAPDYNNGGVITTKASSSGAWSLTRIIDSGFRFYVVADGVASRHVSVAMGIVPSMQVTLSGGSASFRVTADPAQPNLLVHVQSGVNGVWTDIAGGYTSDPSAVYSTTVSGRGAGYYRAVIDADSENNLLKGQTPTIAAGAVSPPATPAPATPAVGAVQFSKIQYKASGLNNEWVRLTNKTKATINLNGWTVRDAAGHIYKFGTAYNLGAGKDMYIHSGKGTNGKPDVKHRYWNRTSAVWNDGGDTAYLRTPAGKTIDTCKWGKGSGVTYC
ncbi:lamin tail domain-containing protein [Actinoplanes sp. TFC3]|uniref:lamin tail domain-containing protein n=1 Tax=Actinoplanes sp. TFC3 TaxID=1710355 RepID=UPI0009EAECDD|nr:lamin tail domain-containing protein [Actinoplanes sp. TFC3]